MHTIHAWVLADVCVWVRRSAWCRTFFRKTFVVPATVHVYVCVRNVGREDNPCVGAYLCGVWKNSATCVRIGFLRCLRLSTVRYEVEESLDESNSCVSPAESLFSTNDFALAAMILRTNIA